MLNPKLASCVDCNIIPNLLLEIDCKIQDISKNLYNNIVFALNRPINEELISDLLNYKRILTYKYCNNDYGYPYTLDSISSKIQLLLHK